jgi:hypothetical protein
MIIDKKINNNYIIIIYNNIMKIAFCFLIYDIINHEDLWNIFFANVDNNKYNIYIFITNMIKN